MTNQRSKQMARYILIDRNSGYIWGDSADLNGKIFDGSPLEYAAALDASNGELDGEADYHETYKSDARATYDVYRADIDGSEAIAIVQDGQDQETIEAVENDCQYVTSIVRTVQQVAL
jgi:hypothetical protein